MKTLDDKTLERAWILLDGAIFDAPRFIYEHDDRPELEYLYLGTPHESVMEVSPCLVKTSSSRIWSEQGKWQKNAVVLISDESIPTLANHLRSLLSVKLPDGAYSYLRFYSPKQLARLMEVFSELERDKFSGPITDWLAIQNNGEWLRFSSIGKAPPKKASDEGWFVLTDHHLQGLADKTKDEFVTRLAKYLSINDSSKLNGLIQQASSFGLNTEKDVSQYAELAVAHGARIEHPELQAILSKSDIPTGRRLSEVDKRLAYGVA
ncbi:hypothetical protein MARI_19030 [Marinobacter sp. JH2]|nr:DUF4123 domain-containing protein [Marinobacter sp. JH2]QBM17782.1 hypothetical protein MARI_19030 [Marinobacter sp. JH2]